MLTLCNNSLNINIYKIAIKWAKFAWVACIKLVLIKENVWTILKDEPPTKMNHCFLSFKNKDEQKNRMLKALSVLDI